ncbi:MAG: hypothetical protein GAK44_00014 [Pseudomonas delhiensis]|nr:MAG: hypothetical protein GAK44_00014 [Pseudomonas delhiensis]
MKIVTASWLLAQTFWVGGLWLLRFIVLPALDRAGLAPLLVQTLADSLQPLLVLFAGACVFLQVLLLVAVRGLGSLLRENRGQLLLLALAAAILYQGVTLVAPDALRWLLFSYLVLAVSGVLLVLQPPPGREGR